MRQAGVVATPHHLETFERWTDQQVRSAIERGAWDVTDVSGKPLTNLDEPHNDLWWLRRKLAEENLSVAPPSLLLRREVQDLLLRAVGASTEAAARGLVDQANGKIRRANRLGIDGPPHNLAPMDPEPVIARWRAARPPIAPVELPAVAPTTEPEHRWFRRRRRGTADRRVR